MGIQERDFSIDKRKRERRLVETRERERPVLISHVFKTGPIKKSMMKPIYSSLVWSYLNM